MCRQQRAEAGVASAVAVTGAVSMSVKPGGKFHSSDKYFQCAVCA